MSEKDGVPTAVTAPLPGFGPVAPQERIETLDILRGFAIFAILVVNWSVDLLWSVSPWTGWTGMADQITYWTIQFTLDEKSWPIFAFLFGLGFSIQMERAEARGASFVVIYMRRLAILFVIGAAHFILTERDILFMYALFGFLLLPLRKLRLNWLVIVALICILIPWGRQTIMAREHALRLADPVTAQQTVEKDRQQRAANQARWAEIDRIAASGSFTEIVTLRAQLFWERISTWTNYLNWLGDPFPPFLLGLFAGRRRIFHEVAAHRQFLRKVMWWGLVLGLAGTAVWEGLKAWLFLSGEGTNEAGLLGSLPYLTRQLARLVERLASPTLGLAYIAGLILLLESSSWKKRMSPLAAVGRMALTNYLLQSVAFVLLFFGYGLGWYGKVGAFGGLLLTIPVIVGEIFLSRWWLKRFRFGPVEWLWRTLTYGKLQPMRIRQPGPIAV